MSDKIIQIKEMNKWFGDFQVLKNKNGRNELDEGLLQYDKQQ